MKRMEDIWIYYFIYISCNKKVKVLLKRRRKDKIGKYSKQHHTKKSQQTPPNQKRNSEQKTTLKH